jgi:hypothetical protein
LDKYSKTAPTVNNPSEEGMAFTQRGGREGNRNKDSFDAKYWKDKDCYNCNKHGHPSSHCPKKKKNGKTSGRKQSDDDASRSSKSSKASITKMQKKMKKSFATLQSKIDEMDEDSELSDSDSDDDGQSHFQFSEHKTTGVPSHNGIVLQQTFKKRNAAIVLKQSNGKPTRLDLRNVILVDSQSTMDLFCNKQLVTNVTKANNKMRLQSNGGRMTVTQKATMPGYKKKVWYSKDAKTNIIALSNLIQQYHITYNSRDQIFVVHREDQGKPNMEFRMHKSGLHYFQPGKEAFAFVNTVSGNKEGYTQRQLKGAESARVLYAKLGYPSQKDFKWVIQSNQINNCPVTVHDVEAAHNIWGKNIAALKGKTTRSKTIHVARDFVKVPKGILKLHKEVFLTCDIFFVNQIPFFITLSRNICFTAVNHLIDRKMKTTYKAFKEIYRFYLNRGFRITTVHADGEFAPLQALIQGMPGGPTVNLASTNKHVPKIE